MSYQLPFTEFKITKPARYRAVVRDSHSTDFDHEFGSYETPEEALAAAKKDAKSHRKTHISYWVEYDLDLAVEGYEGLT